MAPTIIASISPADATNLGERPFHVLVTGFGPFSRFGENPSWLAVRPLNNTILLSDPTPRSKVNGSQAVLTDYIQNQPQTQRPILITTLEIPVTYDAVLDMIPKLHNRPPVLPEVGDRALPPPPASGYDFVFHLGVAGRGPLRVERRGHKLGYHMKDASGKLAPIVPVLPHGLGKTPGEVSAAESFERDRLGKDKVETYEHATARPVRGFGAGYEDFPDEILTDIDAEKLVEDLKQSGIEKVRTSMDAGHYLCDFIYYCSLAEAQRTTKSYGNRRNIPVLFLHCPPVDEPLSTEAVTEAVKRTISLVCREILINEETNGEVHEKA